MIQWTPSKKIRRFIADLFVDLSLIYAEGGTWQSPIVRYSRGVLFFYDLSQPITQKITRINHHTNYFGRSPLVIGDWFVINCFEVKWSRTSGLKHLLFLKYMTDHESDHDS